MESQLSRASSLFKKIARSILRPVGVWLCPQVGLGLSPRHCGVAEMRGRPVTTHPHTLRPDDTSLEASWSWGVAPSNLGCRGVTSGWQGSRSPVEAQAGGCGQLRLLAGHCAGDSVDIASVKLPAISVFSDDKPPLLVKEIRVPTGQASS